MQVEVQRFEATSERAATTAGLTLFLPQNKPRLSNPYKFCK